MISVIVRDSAAMMISYVIPITNPSYTIVISCHEIAANRRSTFLRYRYELVPLPLQQSPQYNLH